DLRLGADGNLDEDPGFESAQDAVLERLVRGVLVDRCGWNIDDVLLLGYGQGGSLALGLASRVRGGAEAAAAAAKFKGVISIGGPLPRSMVPTVSSRPKAATPVLLCRAKRSEGLDDDAVEFVKDEFDKVEVAVWENKAEDGMPASRDEMLPIMRFFAERLRDQGGFGG
ncbi:phospholipase/Carboxylesterase superfamily protein, partial [Magnaporthiopsis poae ATCC 64411]